MKSSVDQDRMPIRKQAQWNSTAAETADEAVGIDRGQQAGRRIAIHHSPRQAAQRRRIERGFGQPLQQKPNRTGLPDELKAKMETTLDSDFSDVRVHAGSSRAGDVSALAYTQGSDIHVAPGQFQPHTAQGKQLLGHELAHVVQQREGRVAPTGEVGGMPLNDDPVLEKEADEMAAKIR
ncbi:MAG: DUF4157 domain-containing protein [Desulfobacteraceae bacterium]|jgi:hypothetical protein